MDKQPPVFRAPAGFRQSDEPALHLGEVVASTYQVREELARTSTGPVFAARDMRLEREAAIKISWRDPGAPALLPEARFCSLVNDPCAVKVFGVGDHHGLEFVAVERAPQATVRAQLTPGGLPVARLLQRVRSIVQAVVSAHDAGLAIGEVSGETVAMDPSGRMVLGRFSLSQIPTIAPHGRSLAPETLVGGVDPSDPNAAAAIDLYGLGCLVFELSTGTPPFACGSLTELLRGHAEFVAPRIDVARDDLPPELGDLVAELLAKAPRARPISADLVREQVEVIIDRANTSMPPVRVLIIDDDLPRASRLRSVVLRATTRATASISSGSDAIARLRRDLPDLVFVEAKLAGSTSALEVCVAANSMAELSEARLVLVGDQIDERDRTVMSSMGLRDAVVRGERLADRIIELVRGVSRPRRATFRKMIAG